MGFLQACLDLHNSINYVTSFINLDNNITMTNTASVLTLAQMASMRVSLVRMSKFVAVSCAAYLVTSQT